MGLRDLRIPNPIAIPAKKINELLIHDRPSSLSSDDFPSFPHFS